ncbi:MAG: hypothetical protein B9S32_00835 [Verrucomicrobia bacterium Tous-C9LFEB]|nr:MAG: hypothetical protein B9S32_00835 [Verrucomicrobia bacterium Tous-C9LFEB]
MPENLAIQSLIKATRILFTVAGSEHGRTVHQIAASLGLKHKTAYRLVRTLEQENFLQRKTNPVRFLLGSTIGELERLNSERHLLTIAGDMLIRAQAKLLCANFLLLELNGTETYHRLCVMSERPGVLIKQRSHTIHFYHHISSILLLAYAQPETQAMLYKAHPFEVEGKSIWKTQTKLNEFLSEIRRTGLCASVDPDNRHYRVATPIFSKGGEVIAAMGGYMPVGESARSRKILAYLCKTTAAEISEKISKSDCE